MGGRVITVVSYVEEGRGGEEGGAYEVMDEESRKGREVAGQYYRLGTG